MLPMMPPVGLEGEVGVVVEVDEVALGVALVEGGDDAADFGEFLAEQPAEQVGLVDAEVAGDAHERLALFEEPALAGVDAPALGAGVLEGGAEGEDLAELAALEDFLGLDVRRHEPLVQADHQVLPVFSAALRSSPWRPRAWWPSASRHSTCLPAFSASMLWAACRLFGPATTTASTSGSLEHLLVIGVALGQPYFVGRRSLDPPGGPGRPGRPAWSRGWRTHSGMWRRWAIAPQPMMPYLTGMKLPPGSQWWQERPGKPFR